MRSFITIILLLTSGRLSAQFNTIGTITSTTNNVGIGTNSPNTTPKLDVNGSVLVRGSGSYAYNNPGTGELQIGYGLAAPATAGTVTRLAIQPYGHTGGPWKFDARDASSTAYLDIYYGGTGTGTGLTIDNTGKFGIGCATPDAKLVIGGSGTIFNVTNLADQDFKVFVTAPSASDKFALIAPSTPTNLALGVNGAEKMRIMNSGSVLIGKSTQANSSYLLDVNGNIRANQITVNTTGADFVFSPRYKLKPLDQLSRYVSANHHLPEIPAATEMRDQGMKVGEVETKLLQKVEELTLYLIDKDAEITKQDRRIRKLETQLQEIKGHSKANSESKKLRVTKMHRHPNTLIFID